MIRVPRAQEVSLLDVRKELSFCKKTKLRVLGIVENMAGISIPLTSLRFVDANGADVTDTSIAQLRERCPELLELRASAEVFPPSKGGAEGMAATFGAPFLGRVPLDPALGAACEAGRSYTARPGGAPTKRDVLRPIVDALLREIGIEDE